MVSVHPPTLSGAGHRTCICMGMVAEVEGLDSVDHMEGEEGSGTTEVQARDGIISRAEAVLVDPDFLLNSNHMVQGVLAGTALLDKDWVRVASLVVALLGSMVARTCLHDPRIIGIRITVYHMDLLATNLLTAVRNGYNQESRFSFCIYCLTHTCCTIYTSFEI